MAKASNKGGSAPATRKTPAATKGATQAAPKATPAPATEAVAEVAKPKRAPAIVQNGVQRPRAGGLCAAFWELTESGMKDGELPSIASVKAAATELGLNPTNVSIEYYRCRQFHGVRGRLKKAAGAEQPTQQ